MHVKTWSKCSEKLRFQFFIVSEIRGYVWPLSLVKDKIKAKVEIEVSWQQQLSELQICSLENHLISLGIIFLCQT